MTPSPFQKYPDWIITYMTIPRLWETISIFSPYKGQWSCLKDLCRCIPGSVLEISSPPPPLLLHLLLWEINPPLNLAFQRCWLPPPFMASASHFLVSPVMSITETWVSLNMWYEQTLDTSHPSLLQLRDPGVSLYLSEVAWFSSKAWAVSRWYWVRQLLHDFMPRSFICKS